MQALKKLGCEVKNIKISSNYVRNGVKRDLMYFGNAVSRLEAVEALRGYIANIPKEVNLSTWVHILSKLENKKEIL